MLKEKVMKFAKQMFAGMAMALCAAAIAPVTQAEAALYESEPNNNPATANQLQLNTWVTGTALSGDLDWYEINIPQQGVSYFEIKPDEENTNASTYWGIQLLDENRNVLNDFNTNRGRKTSSWKTGWKPGKYYLVVRGYYESRGAYNLNFHYQQSEQWEKEFYYGNKNFANANMVELNRWYTGNLYCGDDVDYYHFKLNGTNKISLDFKIDDTVADPGTWYVEFYEYSTKKKLGGESVNTNRSVTTECTGDVIVKVSTNRYYNSAADDQYHIKASVISQNKVNSSSNTTISTPKPGKTTTTTTVTKPSATKITSVKAGKRKATIRWKKASKATGYYVYRATSAKGSYKKIATVNGKTSYTDKKSLKSKKKYYYKVVSIRKSGSKITKAKASGVKSVKIK